MRKGPGSVYDKWNISVVIGDTDITSKLTMRGGKERNFTTKEMI
jgi:hypothetical protein